MTEAHAPALLIRWTLHHSVLGNSNSLADLLAALAELPREVRQALVSWNHATDYELPSYSTYAGGKGTGLFEKTYDLGASAHPAVHPAFWPCLCCLYAWAHMVIPMPTQPITRCMPLSSER